MSVVIINGQFSWTSQTVFKLKSVNLAVRRNSFVGITGIVGSGKSSLISAIAGEMHLNSGSVHVYVRFC